MAPPEVGSEVPVRLTGRITRYNNDDTVNVKFDSRPGRPRKVAFSDVLSMPPPVPPAEPVQALASSAGRDGCSGVTQRTSKARLLSWASVLTVASAVVAGIFHGIGTKVLETVWPYLRPLFRFLT